MVKKSHIKMQTALIFTVVTFFLSCNQKQKETVAVSGKRQITWDLVRRSYHLDPKWGKGITKEASYLNQVNFLIDQKIFAQEAEKEDLQQKNSGLDDYINFLYEKELIKALYREKVSKYVQISEQEILDAYRKSKIRVRFQYIKSPDSLRAVSYLQQLAAQSFETIIPQNPALDEKGTSPLVKFGDVDGALEDALFTTQLGLVNHLVKANNAWYALKVIDGDREMINSGNELEAMRSKLKKIIFDRKAAGISKKYIAEVMKGKSVRLNPPVFNVLSEHFSRLAGAAEGESPIPVNLSNKDLRVVKSDLSSIQNEKLVTFKDGSMTVAEFLTTLSNMPAGLRPKTNMASSLKTAIGQIVRNRYLVQRAKEAGLEADEEMQFEFSQARDDVLARAWLKEWQHKIAVADSEIRRFKDSAEFAVLSKRMPGKPDDALIRDMVFDLKFNQRKAQLADSLRNIYKVDISRSKLLSHIKDPQQIIAQDPVAFFYRENFF